MRSSGTGLVDLTERLALSCERLVHPSVPEPERGEHARLIGLLIAAPFVASAMTMLTLPAQMGLSASGAAIWVLFAVSWLACLLLSATGWRKAVEALALVAGAVTCAMIGAAAGGLSSPLVAMLSCLILEAWWLRGTRVSLVMGGAAALAALGVVPLLGAFFQPVQANAAGWIVPLAYTLLVWARSGFWRADRAGGKPEARVGIEEAIDAVVVRLAPTGEVLEVSRQASGLLGVAPEFLLDNGFFERLHVADRIDYLNALADLRHGADARKVEVRLRLPVDGAHVGARYTDCSLEFAAVTGAPFLMIVRDNTVVAELRRELAEARQADASADRSGVPMLAAASHDLRTPLNAIIGFADTLLHDVHGRVADPRQRECIGLVRRSGEHMLDVIDSVLDVSRLGGEGVGLQTEQFAFRQAAELCCAMLSRQAEEKRLTLRCRISAEAGSIRADRRGVERMLVNLLANAIKFTREGGEIVLEARRIGSKLHFWVSDTGIGIAGADLSRIGEPFVRLNAGAENGSGLGLSLVKSLVSLHQGTITIESEPGRGTTVRVTLPVGGPVDQKPAAIVRLKESVPERSADGPVRRTA